MKKLKLEIISEGNQMSALKNISNCSQTCQDSQVCNENSMWTQTFLIEMI